LKNFTLLLTAGFLFVFSLSTQAQRGNEANVSQKVIAPPVRCGVDEMIQQRLQTDPVFRAHYEEGLRQYEQSLQNSNQRTAWTTSLTGPVTIPVVVHIVLPNAASITDADVLYVINRLNIDYAGINPDSANVPPQFQAVRGHSLLRWTLAKRDASGAYTTGIERRNSTTITIAGGNPQNIKSTAAGGLDAWDVTQYYNVWVGVNNGGLLGIAPEIGPGGPNGSTDCDGVCVEYRGFSRNPCVGTYAQFSNGRTAVHEIGHNFGLYHNFQGGCSATNDFQQLTSVCQIGDPNLLSPSDDTPNQSASTSGCPATAPTVNNQASGCATAPLPPGKMFQCYMDYTDDPCYSMFSIGEVNRMHYVLENCRPGYLTTLGGTPPASAPAFDAAIVEVVRPGGSEMVGTGRYADPRNPLTGQALGVFACTSYPTPTCGGSISPRVRIKNWGTNDLTSVRVNWSLNGGAPSTQTITFSGALPTLYDTVVTLPSITLGTNNSLKFWTDQPNGASNTDQNTSNDTTTKVLNFGGSTLPLSQGFESATFPPAGWSINNPNNNNTWYRATPGSQGSTASTGIDNYNFNLPGNLDDVVSPPIATTGLDSVIIKFDLAHKNYPGLNDHFMVMVSNDCGNTFSSVLTLDDPTTYPTAGASTADYPTPGPTDWATKRVSVGGALISGGQIIVAFRNINGFGNRAFLDNINITGYIATPRDITPTAVLRPLPQECTNTICPQVTVLNNGTQAVTGFSVGYILDGGTPFLNAGPGAPLAVNASTNVTFTSCLNNIANGAHTIKIFTYNPVGASGTGDLFPSNDTISLNFTIVPRYNTFTVDFETTTFPPPFVTINNPNGNFTWVRTSPGRPPGQGKTSIDNYTNFAIGQIDDIVLAALNTVGVDSVILTFDVAHKNYPGFEDNLSVVASTDCGNTYSPTSYSKPGSVLATAGSSTANYTTPGPNDWRNERVAIGGSFMTSGSLILAIRNLNGYGNQIHIDNINIIRKFKRDLAVTSVPLPKSVVCTATNTPQVTVQNVGSETVTAYNVVYTVDGGAPVSTTGTGTPLAPGATTTVNLTNVTFTNGPHTFTVYSSNPVTVSGSGDLNTANDTLRKTVTFVTTVNPPVVEGFESTTFPPTGWAVVNPDNAITWVRTTSAASSGSGSAYVRNYAYSAKGQTDDFVSPQVSYTNVDSVFLSFDVAAAAYSYAGSTSIPLDTLEVLVTKDCGNTFTSVYKKWGAELQTVGDPNAAQNVEFIPAGKNQWRTEFIDLTSVGAVNGPLQVYFRNKNNFQNNIFLDNINLRTRTLPVRLKQEGFLVLPSPFTTQFTVWHYLTPTDLKFVSVYNSVGQLIWKADYSGDAPKLINVDLSNRAAGVYVVHLGYTDANKNKAVRIIKMNQ
jgi:hypothetical protein